MKETCGQPKHNFKTKKIVIVFLILNILYNAFKFLNVEGSDHPLVWSLFNMILSLGILVLLCHKKEIMENKIIIFKQSLMTDFFQRVK